MSDLAPAQTTPHQPAARVRARVHGFGPLGVVGSVGPKAIGRCLLGAVLSLTCAEALADSDPSIRPASTLRPPVRDELHRACNAFGLRNQLSFEFGFRDLQLLEPVFKGLKTAGFPEEPE